MTEMKIAGLSSKDAWVTRVVEEMERGTLAGQQLVDVPTEDTVLVDTVDLEHDGPETAYRPYLALTGRLLESTPMVELPYGINAVTLSSEPGTPVAYRYDFTDEQISELVLTKGLHSGSFVIPEEFTGIEWKLPGQIDALIASPADFDSPPVVFVDVKESTERRVDVVSSGYELVDYIPGVQAEQEQEHTVDKQAPVVDIQDDLFADQELERPEEPQEAQPQEQEETEAESGSAFDRLMTEAKQRAHEHDGAERLAQLAKDEAQRDEVDPDSVEGIYQSVIAPSLEQIAEQPTEEKAEAIASEAAERAKSRRRAAEAANEPTLEEDGSLSFD